jgi:hypothetical protein
LPESAAAGSMLFPLAQADCLIIREPFAPAAEACSVSTMLNLQF